MSGYEVARAVRGYTSEDPALQAHVRGVRLLALSSVLDRDAKECEAEGFDAFLSKPIKREKVFQVIEKWGF
ncbi:MAG: hypothetical protein DRH20_14080 [Deltaproteobacteria bacterium]|nr:MAG: hypothetical protein DRH20_14080 [Deltaproteobacteria bacterium]